MRIGRATSIAPHHTLGAAAAIVAVILLGACDTGLATAPGPADATTVPVSAAPSDAIVASPPPEALPPATTSATCRPTDQDRYVYSPDRLVVRARCLRVSGTIDEIRQEADGDLHILLRLDPRYAGYLMPTNAGQELGDLVVEPICVHPASQADAAEACASDPDPLQNLPHSGMAVWMEGRYVLDTDHGSWAELHPLYRWGPMTTSGSAAGATAVPVAGGATLALRVSFTELPNPASIGGVATIGGRTSAGATCSIRVTLPSGRVSTNASLGLVETADGSGRISWTWSIRSNTRPGTASARLTCTLGSRAGSATASFPMLVT